MKDIIVNALVISFLIIVLIVTLFYGVMIRMSNEAYSYIGKERRARGIKTEYRKSSINELIWICSFFSLVLMCLGLFAIRNQLVYYISVVLGILFVAWKIYKLYKVESTSSLIINENLVEYESCEKSFRLSMDCIKSITRKGDSIIIKTNNFSTYSISDVYGDKNQVYHFIASAVADRISEKKR